MQNRIDLLNILKVNYGFSIINDRVIIVNKHGRQLRPIFCKGRSPFTKYILWKDNKRYDFLEKELYSILGGIIYSKRIYHQKFKNICSICNLDYPKDEMRGNICYLCKEELKNVKSSDYR